MRGLLTVVLVAAAATLVAGSLTADAAHRAAQHKIVTVHAGGALGFAFGPSTAKAKLGDSVHWVFDSSGHTSTDSSMLALWDSGGPLPSGATFDHTFAQAGTYAYKCTFHAGLGM